MNDKLLLVSARVACAALIALSINGCINGAEEAPPGSSAVVAVEPTATAAELYKEIIGNYRFQRSHLELQSSGYTVESGKLLSPSGDEGALILVRAADGALTAIVSRTGKQGLWQVSADGQSRFSEDQPFDFMQHDTVPDAIEAKRSAGQAAASGDNVIYGLFGFTQAALEARPVDPVAFAFAQAEFVNLSLRNSQINNIRLDVAGVRVLAENIPVTQDGLRRWGEVQLPVGPDYYTDIYAGFSTGGNAGGWASVPGRSSVNEIKGVSPFKHEFGHNVGGNHCNDTGQDNYKFGFNAGGGFTTNLCGNSKTYYSNPDVVVDGKRIGDERTANMARLWREQVARLSGYGEDFVGSRLVYTSYQQEAKLPIVFNRFDGNVGVVALSPEVGPTSLIYGGEGVTTLTVKLLGAEGSKHPVNFRAVRTVNGCTTDTTMNSYVRCHPDAGHSMTLTLSYHLEDNPELAPGWYNGTVQLKALDRKDAAWSVPILVSLAVRR